ncbi:hypothetical protein IPC1147_33105 [Pseudomonas aeruginosa]|uniref:hypothetical protein n=1 Tax=Pseudomonas aeruginosa TaxID=287 RepID=UPI000E6973BE|nr:hypothetical protein [Pseudomonas aeruginosa]MBA5107658.1 hypothetical protein [Pseudomonas aeruginosa]MBD1300097.1 hypothetical protein [Pseudomonas aeruginosa]MBD1340662.1 hypothetical protein [Pseudomonas aeruginosa]MCO2528448.1 hypothetical protein [Pseudomonas aeruginosa]MCO2541422.1 hypothetical protein [Pseudomonas aeruginosa]
MDFENLSVKPKTKLVTLHLYKVTRRQYQETLEVPENATPGEISAIAEARFAALDDKQFKPDRKYRKREAFVSSEGLVRGVDRPAFTALRNTDGKMVVSEKAPVVDTQAPESLASSLAVVPYQRH